MSWQNRVVSAIIRHRIKPLSLGEPDIDRINAAFALWRWKPRLARGWRIRAADAPPLLGEWIEPETEAEARAARRTLLYLHGGAYALCSPQSHRPITFALASRAPARLFALDYRLAPRHRFPAAVEDAVAAYRALLADGTAAARVMLAGDSAGGGLALATLLAAKAEGLPMPAGAVLFSPWTDLAATGGTLVSNHDSDVMFHAEGVPRAARNYLGDASPTDPLASPLYGDLSGLPPLLIQVSDSEALLDDSTRIAIKARTAGVAVELTIWHRLPHVWQYMTPFLPEARQALDEATAFIRGRMP